jgi:hypothetical protein
VSGRWRGESPEVSSHARHPASTREQDADDPVSTSPSLRGYQSSLDSLYGILIVSHLPYSFLVSVEYEDYDDQVVDCIFSFDDDDYIHRVHAIGCERRGNAAERHQLSSKMLSLSWASPTG